MSETEVRGQFLARAPWAGAGYPSQVSVSIFDISICSPFQTYYDNFLVAWSRTDKKYASVTTTASRRAARRPPRWRGSARSLAAPRRPVLGHIALLPCISRVRCCRRAPRAQAACLLGYPPPSPGSSMELFSIVVLPRAPPRSNDGPH